MSIEYFSRNKTLLADGDGYRLAAECGKVNINWWHTHYGASEQNLGDMLSDVICSYMCDYYRLDKDRSVGKTKHLYAVGSIMYFENQDAVVWGTGATHLLKRNLKNYLHQRLMRRLDVRAVRGPLTRQSLRILGIQCPELYGDPATLMPLIYSPNRCDSGKALVLKRYKSVVEQITDSDVITSSTITNDWKKMIDTIASARLVISSSLHGIILAESYGVPAVLLKEDENMDLFKYRDYYLGTGRADIPIVHSVDEGLEIDSNQIVIPDVSMIQRGLISSFPVDLYEK